jgi:hypothetical protein
MDTKKTNGEIKITGGKLILTGNGLLLRIGDLVGVKRGAQLVVDGSVKSGEIFPRGVMGSGGRQRAPAKGSFVASGTINDSNGQIVITITLHVTAPSGPFK